MSDYLRTEIEIRKAIIEADKKNGVTHYTLDTILEMLNFLLKEKP